MIDIDVLSEAYLIMKEYVNPKDRQSAADHLISALEDTSIDDHDLRKFAATDAYLKQALGDHLDDYDEDSGDDLDYEDD